MVTMKSRKFEEVWLMPGVSAPCCDAMLPIRQIPALQALLPAAETPTTDEKQRPYDPARRVYVSQNEDGTFSVLNDVELIRPDIIRIAPDRIRACIVRLEEPLESLFRAYLLLIEPTRRRYSGAQFIDKAQTGRLDAVTHLYMDSPCNPRGYKALGSVLVGGQLPHSTFYRRRRKLRSPQTANEEEPRAKRSQNAQEPNRQSSKCSTEPDTTKQEHQKPDVREQSELF